MKQQLLKLIFIGLISGTVLAAFLIGVYLLTGIEAYYLLFNVDYIPLLKMLQSKIIVEIAFHYFFCIFSVIGLYYMLTFLNKERHVSYYVSIYTLGSASLFFLTGLSEHTPDLVDMSAWVYWSVGHAIYGFIVGFLVAYWLRPHQ